MNLNSFLDLEILKTGRGNREKEEGGIYDVWIAARSLLSAYVGITFNLYPLVG